MNLREDLLSNICKHFSISYIDYETETFQSFQGELIPNQLLSREEVESYELYDIPNPFLLFLIDYSRDYTANLFLAQETQAFSRIATSPQTLSGLHRHNYFELVYVIEGQLDLMIEKKHHRLFPHNACIINSNVRHVEEYRKNYTAIYLALKPDFFNNTNFLFKANNLSSELLNFFQRNLHHTEDIDYLDFTPIFADSSESVRNIKLLRRLFSEMLTQEVGFLEICQQYINRLFSYFQNPSTYICSNTYFQQLSGQTIFERTLNYIHANKRKLTRNDLSEALHYNGNYISHVFHQHTGQTLADYIRNVCLSESADLLLNTNMQIAEIIQQIGFENKTAFYNQFKKRYGITPRQYRKNGTF